MAERQRSEGCVRGCPIGNLALEMADRDEAIRQKVAGVMASWASSIARVLRRAHERGELHAPDPERVARAVVAYFEGAVMLAKTTNDATVFEQLAPGALALVEGASREWATSPAPTGS
jgi:TetR/AcrR family transcriptional repressor of nem operon